MSSGCTSQAYPATVSDLSLDKYEITVGRFREFVAAWNAGWRPGPGAGKHTHLNGGSGLDASAGAYETGWDASWQTNLVTTPTEWSDVNHLSCSASAQTWTSSKAANEKPIALAAQREGNPGAPRRTCYARKPRGYDSPVTEELRTQFDSPAVGIDRSEQMRRTGRVALAITAVLGCALVVLSGLDVAVSFWAWFAAYALGATSLAMFASAASRLRPVTHPAQVMIRHGVLYVRYAPSVAPVHVIPLEDVLQGWEEPQEVRFALKNGQILVIRTGSPSRAEALLRAAGASAEKRALRVPLASAAALSPGGRGPIGILLGVLCVLAFARLEGLAEALRVTLAGGSYDGSALAQLAGLAVIVPPAFLLSLAFRRREAIVGTDGVMVRGSLGKHLVRYDDLAQVQPDTRGLLLSTRDGARRLLPTLGADESPLRPRILEPGEPLTDAEARRSALFERIHQAMRASAEGAEVWAGLDQLDRKGRPVEAWREALRHALSHATDYRRVGLGPADLAAVIGDPNAPSERRVAAAVALSAVQPDEAKRRARIAADACADDSLRRALERAAEGELDEALLEQDARRAMRAG